VSQTHLSASRASPGRRRVHAAVALAVLETLRSQDLPPEILDDENLTLTLPRRLGLSDVIESQIRRYREEARRGRRIPEQEMLDLLRLVIRRPDSEDVFREVGHALHRPVQRGPFRPVLPTRIILVLARRRVERRLRTLFGGRLVKGSGKGFVLEAADDFLIASDPGGDACHLVTGLATLTLRAYVGDGARVIHSSCVGARDAGCRWEMKEDE
jgi:hypothetical protein